MLLPNESLDLLFKRLKKTTELVILLSCLSHKQATLISKHIPCVIGCNTEINNQSAIKFSLGLYNGLANGDSLDVAFESGKISVSTLGYSEQKAFEAWSNGKKLPW